MFRDIEKTVPLSIQEKMEMKIFRAKKSKLVPLIYFTLLTFTISLYNVILAFVNLGCHKVVCILTRMFS